MPSVTPLKPPQLMPVPTPGGLPNVPRTGPVQVPTQTPIIVPVPVPVQVAPGFGPAQSEFVVAVVSLRNESKATVRYEFAFGSKYEKFELEPGAERFHASDPVKPDRLPIGHLKYKDGDRERKLTLQGKPAPLPDFDSGRLFRFVAERDSVAVRGAKP
jgi:hypothetical protein